MDLIAKGKTLADVWRVLRPQANNLKDDLVLSVFYERGCVVAMLEPVYESDGVRFTKSMIRARVVFSPQTDGVLIRLTVPSNTSKELDFYKRIGLLCKEICNANI